MEQLRTKMAQVGFLKAKRAKNLSPETLDRYERSISAFAAAIVWLPCPPEALEGFLSGLTGVYHPNTVKKEFAIIRTFLKWCERRKGLPSPHRDVETPRGVDTVPRYLEPDELIRLLRGSCTPRDRALLLLLADTGMRIGEVCSMRRSMVYSGFIVVEGKVGPRMVPVSPIVLSALRELPEHGDTLWWGKQGPMTKHGLKSAVRKAMREAGITGTRIGPHTLRHTFATLWQGDDQDAKQIGGWRSDASMSRYRHFRLARASKAQALHSPVQQVLAALRAS